MKVIDLSKITKQEWDNGYLLWRINAGDCPQFSLSEDPNETYRLILPEFSDLYLTTFTLNKIPNLEFDECEGGCYLPYLGNPYYYFVKPAKGAKRAKINVATKKILTFREAESLEELIVEAEEVTFENNSFSHYPKLRRLEFKEGTSLTIISGSFTGCQNLEELIMAEREKIFMDDHCFQYCRKLGQGEVRLPTKNITYGRECFNATAVQAVYIDASITRIDDCFSPGTKIFYGGDLAVLRVSHSCRQVQTGEWDGDPHHPVSYEYETTTEYASSRATAVGFATPEDYWNYLKTI